MTHTDNNFSVDLNLLKVEIEECINSELSFNQIKAKIFGQDGCIPNAIEQAKKIPIETRGSIMHEIQELRKHYQMTLAQKFNAGTNQKLDATIPTDVDIGLIHPISAGIIELKRIMDCFGFTELDAPSIEDAEMNFDELNIGPNHPARGDHDTFYLNCGKLLRTHTSNAQIHALRNKISTPDAIFHVGKVYRRDDDSTHSPMFHQIEAMVLDNVTFANLKYMIREVLYAFFGSRSLELRFRPNYFPFTSLSLEVDLLYTDEKSGSRWMEVLGAGMVRKNILEKYGYDCNGFAFGMGIERLVMLKYKISNIGDLYRNKFPFLKNFGIPPKEVL